MVIIPGLRRSCRRVEADILKSAVSVPLKKPEASRSIGSASKRGRSAVVYGNMSARVVFTSLKFTRIER